MTRRVLTLIALVAAGCALLVPASAAAAQAAVPDTATGAAAPAPSFPTYVSGRVVDAKTGKPVAGVVVSARDVGDLGHVYAWAITNSRGYFKLRGVPVEEVGLRVNGRWVGYERGWVACDRTVVPTWGEACSHGTGWIGVIRLDRG